MNKYNGLKPVKRCWVRHEKLGDGLVQQVMEGLDGVTLKFLVLVQICKPPL